MMRKMFCKITAVLMAVFMFAAVCPTVTFAASGTDTLFVEGTCDYDRAFQVLDQVNAEREAQGLNDLTMDYDLLDAAMQRAAECSVYFDHTRPSGDSCFSISSKANGENIAAGQSSASAVMDSWMNSSEHRDNILNGSFQSIGVGCFVQGNTVYWVQLFGTGAASPVSQPSNQGGYAKITFSPSLLSGALSVSLSESQIDAGASASATVRLTNPGANGSVSLETSQFSWSSSSDAAAVDAYGTVTGLNGGSAEITAMTPDGGLAASTTISVIGAEPEPEPELEPEPEQDPEGYDSTGDYDPAGEYNPTEEYGPTGEYDPAADPNTEYDSTTDPYTGNEPAAEPEEVVEDTADFETEDIPGTSGPSDGTDEKIDTEDTDAMAGNFVNEGDGDKGESDNTGEPTDIDEPTDSEGSIGGEEPTDAEKSTDDEEPTDAEKSTDDEEPTDAEKSTDDEEPTGAEGSLDDGEPSDNEDSEDDEETEIENNAEDPEVEIEQGSIEITPISVDIEAGDSYILDPTVTWYSESYPDGLELSDYSYDENTIECYGVNYIRTDGGRVELGNEDAVELIRCEVNSDGELVITAEELNPKYESAVLVLQLTIEGEAPGSEDGSEEWASGYPLVVTLYNEEAAAAVAGDTTDPEELTVILNNIFDENDIDIQIGNDNVVGILVDTDIVSARLNNTTFVNNVARKPAGIFNGNRPKAMNTSNQSSTDGTQTISLPKTGDTNAAIFYLILIAAACGAVIGIVIFRRRRSSMN